MGATAKNDGAGLISGLSYAILGTYDLNGVKLIKMKSHWAGSTYKGRYSRNDEAWKSPEGKANNELFEDENVFYVPVS